MKTYPTRHAAQQACNKSTQYVERTEDRTYILIDKKSYDKATREALNVCREADKNLLVNSEKQAGIYHNRSRAVAARKQGETTVYITGIGYKNYNHNEYVKKLSG